MSSDWFFWFMCDEQGFGFYTLFDILLAVDYLQEEVSYSMVSVGNALLGMERWPSGRRPLEGGNCVTT